MRYRRRHDEPDAPHSVFSLKIQSGMTHLHSFAGKGESGTNAARKLAREEIWRNVFAMPVTTYEMSELEKVSGMSPRTIRKYIRMSLLPRGRGKGPATVYDERHMRRLKAICALRAQGVKLSAIKTRLHATSDDELNALLGVESVPKAPAREPDAPVTPTYPSRACEIVELMDGLTLTVDPNKGQVVQRIAAAIYRHYAIRP